MDTDSRPFDMKVMTFLDATPGRADRPAPDGEKIAILTFAHRGEIEQPMMLTLGDTKKLAISLLETLAHHGDEKAEKACEIYVDESDA